MGFMDRFKKKTDEAVDFVREEAEEIVEDRDDPVASIEDATPRSVTHGVPTTEEVVEEIRDAGHDLPPAHTGATAADTEAAVPAPPTGDYRKVRIKPGRNGWGVGFEMEPKPGKDLIYSVTGGGIHPVAQRIADLSGGKTFDGFKSKAGFDEIAVAVIDCGGTARIGVYPMKGVLTVDVHGASPSGPLVRFITEENFVSGVTPDDIEVLEG